mmetsp:Transcript_131288/g.228228  ORF Transcript_131288/g.228228 Transcript_131288/m.228228 type:complete len:106 (-) Transcript_131288:127-444(-)
MPTAGERKINHTFLQRNLLQIEALMRDGNFASMSLHEFYSLFHRTIMITLQATLLLIPLISWALAITTSMRVQVELCATNAKGCGRKDAPLGFNFRWSIDDWISE